MPIEKHSITANWWEYNKTDVDGMEVCKGRSVLFIWLFVWLYFLFPLLFFLGEICWDAVPV